METPPALFNALSTSARQLFQLLRCIAFSQKAEIQVTARGIRVSTEESRAVQGVAFLDDSLFSSYMLSKDQDDTIPSFQISLSALLETLQIFGVSDAGSGRNGQGGFSSSYAAAFNTPALGITGTCRISYPQIGAPLGIIISEGAVTTTCELNTYELPHRYADDDGTIPLDRNAVILKVIMRSAWLFDAITELSGTNPTDLEITASNTSPPYFALEGHGGPFGDSIVDYTPEGRSDDLGHTNAPRAKKQPTITETFKVAPPSNARGRLRQRYNFDHIKKATRAMALASKVSLRMDRQGVLSLQFMIEVGETGTSYHKEARQDAAHAVNGTGKVSFVDFRFVPQFEDDEDGEEGDGREEADEDSGDHGLRIA